jgi:hypothetical protein
VTEQSLSKGSDSWINSTQVHPTRSITVPIGLGKSSHRERSRREEPPLSRGNRESRPLARDISTGFALKSEATRNPGKFFSGRKKLRIFSRTQQKELQS